jgi:hypothetical protein
MQETMWPAKLEMFTLRCFIEKDCSSLVYIVQILASLKTLMLNFVFWQYWDLNLTLHLVGKQLYHLSHVPVPILNLLNNVGYIVQSSPDLEPCRFPRS